MLPHKVSLVSRLKKSKVGFVNPQASSKYFFIEILEEYSKDVGLYTHEYEHVKQWYMFLVLGLLSCTGIYFAGYPVIACLLLPLTTQLKAILYTFVRPARLWMEVKAFRAQMKHYKDEHHLEFFAESLSSNYDLKITKEEALKLLSK